MTRLLPLTAVALCLAGEAAAQVKPGDAVAFIACPIAQDTGPDTDLCFFAEHRGERILLLNPPDTGGPELKHKVLVEGVVTDAPRLCGALRIDGRFTPLRELSPECDTLLPFDGKTVVPAGSAFSVVQRRTGLDELAARAEKDPSLSVLPMTQPEPPPPPPPARPYAARSLELTYLFDSDRGQGPAMGELVALADYAKAIKARSVTVEAYRGATRLEDGALLTEVDGMAQRRAEKLKGLLAGLGVPAASITARWIEKPRPADGRDDWRERKAIVSVTP